MKKILLLIVLVLGLIINSNSQSTQTVATDFTVTDLDGNQYHLFDILAQGKYAYLEFSFIGCTYCVAQIPDMNQIYTDHGCNQKDVVFLSFFSPSDDSTDMVQYKIDHGPIEYPLIFGSHDNGTDNGGSVYDYYAMPGHPGGVLIAPNHDVVEQDLYPNLGVHSTFSGYGIGQYACGIVADFSGTPLSIPYGGTVDFTDLSSNFTPTSWDWVFENAQQGTSNVQNPTGITYTVVGTHDVTLTVSDGNSTDSEIKTNYIEVLAPANLTAEFIANVTTIVEGQTVDFTDLSLGGGAPPSTWSWAFNGAVTPTSTVQHPTGIQYNTIGDYTVSLNVGNGISNNTKTKVNYIHVVDSSYLPKADFIANYTIITAGNTVDFTNLSTGIVNTCQWTFTGANTTSSTDHDPLAIQYDNVGDYPVTLEVYNSVGADTMLKTAYIHVIDPSLYDTLYCDFKAISSRLIVQGSSVSFEDLTVGYPTSWEWEFDGAVTTTSTVQNPQSIVYNVPGLYEVRLKVTNGLYSDSIAKYQYIVVTDLPWADENGYCDTIGNISNIEMTTSPRHLGGSEWGYFPGHNSYNVKVYADKYVNYTFSDISALLVPVSTIYSASSSGRVKFIIWDVDSVTGMPGNELVTQQVNINTFTPYLYHSIEFNTTAQVNGEFFIGFQLYYSTPLDTFTVYMVDNRGPNQLNTLYAKKGYTWYTPSQLLQDTLNTSLAIKVVGCLVSVEDKIIEDNLNIYPNPTNGIVNINLGDDVLVKDIDIKVYDLLGKELKLDYRPTYSNNYEFNMRNNPTGIYILNIKVNNTMLTRKISFIK